MIILITASLSSNTYNNASWREDWTFEGTESIFSITLIFPWIFFRVGNCEVLQELSPSPQNKSEISWQRSDPRSQVRVYRPSLNLHPKKWFLNLLRCAKLKFVSYTNVCLPKMHNVHLKWILSPQDLLQKSESWSSPSLHCLAALPTWQYCLNSHVWWIYEIKRDDRLSQAFVHFVIDRASLFTAQRISVLPIRAKCKHFRTIWEHTSDTSPTDFICSSL